MNLYEANPDLAEAILRQWTWKTPAMKAMTLAVCRLALARGNHPFSALDLPADLEHGGRGIAGAVFNRLARDGVLSPCGVFVEGEFQQRTVANAGGNRIGLWRLLSGPLARRALELHGVAEPALRQAEMVIA